MSWPWVALDPTLIVVAAGTSAVGAVSGALGCFAYLRRQGLVGDVVSHSALLGVVGAFVLTHAVTGSASRSLAVLVPGALLAGTAALMLARSVSIRTRLKDDASLGVMLSIFFGGGLFLLRWVQRQSPPIPGHTGLEDYIFGMAAAMTRADLWMILALGGCATVALLLLWKELKVFTFDPDFSRSLGFPARLLDSLTMALLVMGVVIGIQTVGVILMIALLVTPAAAARQWTSRLSTMVLLAATFGAGAGAGGALMSASEAGLPTGPVVVLLATATFVVSLLLAPRRGVIARAQSRRAMRDLPPPAAGRTS
ncbi:MAG: iron chelate uptake ABC transporter family permease subunit [Planctomycetota bacterium]|nr:iron chelate uptake ABC transporter family permease subunit [Planctomycetota bacterium]MDG1984318.1 iron chelate uptake ABC transporter family permease subunit [Planctomycetota bacterium]